MDANIPSYMKKTNALVDEDEDDDESKLFGG